MILNHEKCYMGFAELLRERMEARDRHAARLLAGGRLEEINDFAAERREILRRALVRDFKCEEKSPLLVKTRKFNEYRIDCYRISGAGGCDIPVNLYVPAAGAGIKHPAVIVPVGHWPAGKSEANVQRLCAGFARRGIIAATYDPVNQGERCPVSADDYLKARPGLSADMLPVAMHMLPGNLFYMLGENLGSLFLWEGMRVCDLLCGLEEADSARIGVTGQSGGGTQSLYLAALDERIIACSPVQCLTKLAGIVRHFGIGDCEQSILDICMHDCFDYADFLWALFPKPLMINASKDDFFSLDGVLELFTEISELYRFSDAACELRVAEGGHVMGRQSRQFALDFFCDVFDIPYLEVAFVTEEDDVLYAAELDCFDSRPACATAVARQMLEDISPRRPEASIEILDRVKSLLGANRLPDTLVYEETAGRFSLHAGHARLEGLLERKSCDFGITVFLGPVSSFSGLERFPGAFVIADPLCIALAAEKCEHGYDAETRLFNIGAMMGAPPASVRCGLISLLLDELEKQGLHSDQVTIAARGTAGIQALYAAALDPRISKIVLRGTPDSLDAYFYDRSLVLPETMIMPGLSAVCDLKRLAESIPARVIWDEAVSVMEKVDLTIYEILGSK